MSDTEISLLPPGSAVSGTEVIPAVQGGSTVGLTVSQILAPAMGHTIVDIADFSPLGDGVGDDTGVVLAVVAAAAALSGAEHGDSMGQAPYGYGISRRIALGGKKYVINSPIVLSGDVGFYADGGGFIAGPFFPAGQPMIDTGTAPYGGRGDNVTLDGGNRNVKGILFRNVNGARWDKLSVVSCQNDGIIYQGGAELTLTAFEVAGSATPVAKTVAGLRLASSDGHFIGGVVKFTPIGVKEEAGSGNNELVAVHCWGLYAAFRQYVSFWLTASVRNNYTDCYGDSPAMQDYAQDNIVVLNGIPNGGICWYLDSTSAQNVLTGARGHINTAAWATYAAANSITGNKFWAIYCAGQFNQISNLIYNYAGPWAGDVRFDANATRDSCLVMGSPNLANGLRVAVLGSVSDAGGGVQDFSVENTNAAFATSAASMTWKIGGNPITVATSTFGPSGSSFWTVTHIGGERLRLIANGSFQPGSDNAQNWGNGSFRWATIFAGTGTINTSDQREKDGIRSLSDAEKAVGAALKALVRAYQWTSSVALKGAGARTHVGWIAQEVIEVFTANGLDPFAYGVCCHDTWEAEDVTHDKYGNVVRPAVEAGDRFSLRHDELMAFIVATS